MGHNLAISLIADKPNVVGQKQVHSQNVPRGASPQNRQEDDDS